MRDGNLARDTLDTFPINVAVVDATGEIVLTNRAWRSFAADERERRDDVGENYFAAADADEEHATAAVAGLRAVLSGEREQFKLEYPCHSPEERRWFLMRVSPVEVDGERGAVVAHVDITDRKEAELAADRRADQLSHLLDRVDGLVRDVTGAVVGARSRGAVESGLCEAVVGTDPYTFAWVGRPDLRAESLVPRSWAGAGPAEVEARTLSLSTDAPAARAYRTGELQVVSGAASAGERNGDEAENEPENEADDERDDKPENEADDERDDKPENEADDERDDEAVAADGASAVADDADPLDGWAPVPRARAVAAVPLSYRASTYGVVSVYAADPNAFDEYERSVLGALGAVAATAVHAVTSGRVLEDRSVVELAVELAVPDTHLAALAGEDATVTHQDTFVGEDGTVHELLAVAGIDGATLRRRAEDSPGVGDVTVLAETDDGVLIEVGVDSSLVATVADFDGETAELSVTDGTASATLWFADEERTRLAFEHLRERHGSVELVGYRERERTADSAEGFRAELSSSLTDRQLTALRRAYHGGYFEWPRDVSGEDVADAMGITRATFHQHLREAQRKLAAAFLEHDTPP
jgi:PAS domain S-box-containing protein